MIRGQNLPAITQIADSDVLIVDSTSGGTRKITYAQLCQAVKQTLGIREVIDSVNITQDGYLMGGKVIADELAKLNDDKSGKLSVAVRTLTFASVPINGIAQQTLGIAMDGYEPVGAVGWANAGSTEFYPYQLTVNGTTLVAYIKSVSTSALSNVSINVYVLFKAVDY